MTYSLHLVVFIDYPMFSLVANLGGPGDREGRPYHMTDWPARPVYCRGGACPPPCPTHPPVAPSRPVSSPRPVAPPPPRVPPPPRCHLPPLSPCPPCPLPPPRF